MIAYADFGNTRAKVWVDGSLCILEYADRVDTLLPDVTELVYVSVIDEDLLIKIVDRCFPGQPSLKEAVVSDIKGLKCLYETPHSLGVDRWVAACAANSHYGSCVVVDAGTAITIDLVKDGAYLGGLILPGLDMMASSLISNTAKINAQAVDVELGVGRSTASAVTNGALFAAVGAIKLLYGQQGPNMGLVLTGGSASLICEFLGELKSMAVIDPNLIKKGLKLVKVKGIG